VLFYRQISWVDVFNSDSGSTCLGYLGKSDANRNKNVCIALPKVVKASKAKTQIALF